MREVLENRGPTDRASLKLPPLVVAGAGQDEGGAGEHGAGGCEPAGHLVQAGHKRHPIRLCPSANRQHPW